MADSKNTTELLETVASILLRCFVFGFLFLLLWAALFALAPGLIHDVHGKLFDLSPHEVAVIHYCGMGLVKMCVLLFFLFPYFAIRLVLRRKVA